jgi:putative glutamine amidotransferase
MAGSASLEVNSFHDFGFRADDVTSDWEVTALSEPDEVVEGLIHRTLPFVGVGWHPERPKSSSEFDRRLLEWRFGDGGPRQQAETTHQ